MVGPRDGWFVGIPLPSASSALFTSLVHAASSLPGVRRPQDPATAHLTLRFFGALGALEQESLRQLLEELAPRSAFLPLTPSGWDTFGPIDDPQVLVIRIEEHPRLVELAEQFRALSLGSEDLLPFRPHITVARFFRGARAADAVAAFTRATPLPATLGDGDTLCAYAAPDRHRTQVVQHAVRFGSGDVS